MQAVEICEAAQIWVHFSALRHLDSAEPVALKLCCSLGWLPRIIRIESESVSTSWDSDRTLPWVCHAILSMKSYPNDLFFAALQSDPQPETFNSY